MIETLMRAFGLNEKVGAELRKAGDWLEKELKKLGFSPTTRDAAYVQLAIEVMTGLRMRSKETPRALAEKIRDLMIAKRREVAREN